MVVLAEDLLIEALVHVTVQLDFPIIRPPHLAHWAGEEGRPRPCLSFRRRSGGGSFLQLPSLPGRMGCEQLLHRPLLPDSALVPCIIHEDGLSIRSFSGLIDESCVYRHG